MTPPQLKQLKTFAKASRLSVSQVVREAVLMRMDVENPYNKGFNDGLDCAISTASNNSVGQMRFPDGKSFCDVLADDISIHRRS
jgi:hypothetical protein